jgi:hypothetical protein
MKLTDPIKSSTVNRVIAQRAKVGIVALAAAAIFYAIDRGVSERLMFSGLFALYAAYWIYDNILPDVERDEQAMAANAMAPEGQPLEQVGTSRWAYYALGIALVAMGLMFLIPAI